MTDSAITIAASFVASFEGFRAAPYRDSGGVWTQGFGCTFHPGGQSVKPTDAPVTEIAATAWMEALLIPTMARVRQLVCVTIGDNSSAALCSFAFNVGTGALGGSTLLRLLNQGDFIGASHQFGAWIYDNRGNTSKGLIARRAAESALFIKPDAVQKQQVIQQSDADRLMDAELIQLNHEPL